MKNFDIFPAETKKQVLEKINTSIPGFENLLIRSYENFQMFEKGILRLTKNEEEFKGLLEYSIFLCISWLDISYDMKTHLSTNSNYERIFTLRNLTIHLNEGYKRNYHFVESKRKESLWINIISEMCKQDEFSDFQIKVNNLTNSLLKYEKEFQKDSIKKDRDIFVHYQGSPINVYESFNNIDILFLVENATNYLNVSTEIINLITDLTNRISKNYCS